MYRIARPFLLLGLGLVVFVGARPGFAQSTPADAWPATRTDFITGEATRAWQLWAAAMKAQLERNADGVEGALGELLALNPAPLRIALLADHTIRRTNAGGAVLLFEQDRDAGALRANGQRVATLLATGREQMLEAEDGFYFSQIGRFDVAAANWQALLADNPDPVSLVEFTDRVPRRREILIQLQTHPTLGDSVRRLMDLLAEGERLVKSDPTRIQENIRRLGGAPRAFENALQALIDSGEQAVPFMIQFLRDRTQLELRPAILTALPRLGRPGLNPLVAALRMNDTAVKQDVIAALGEIGYSQAVPYLLAVAQAESTPPEVIIAIRAALERIVSRGVAVDISQSAAEAFYQLAEAYYADAGSLAADHRLATAEVWYWRDEILQNVSVPTAIFNEVMAMRCAEETLVRDPGHQPALALWLAANFRRQAQLGLEGVDATRPASYPTGLYFAQSAGPAYCLLALARAVDDSDPAVALGAIDALRRTAGPASLVGDAEGRLPLAEALSFGDRMVRVRAALTLGHARPEHTFLNSQNLMPVLAEALQLHGGVRNALVVDPEELTANAAAAALRAQGYDVLVDGNLFTGLEKVRTESPGVDLVLLGSDVRSPDLAAGLAAMRAEFRFAATPVLILAKPGQLEDARRLSVSDARVEFIPANALPGEMNRAVALVLRTVGTEPITPEIGVQLALDAAGVLRDLALTNNPVFEVADVETALLAAFTSEDAVLRRTIADVLGFIATTAAQETIARRALDAAVNEDERVQMFTSLADAAKRRGNLLPPELVAELVKLAEGEPNLRLREAASQTLGALNLPGSPASAIIRNQHQG